MGLTEYKRKRNLNKTPEPSGGKSKAAKLSFVVQKHAASHLHYDFRLELRGVLKSWAVPKGPSMDPSVKRLAMMVEDHPFDYKDFEGIIPPGNYGAGTVIIWDEGTFEPMGTFKTKTEQEKELTRQLYSRDGLKLILHGKKLKGEFHLFPTKGRGENSWLLMKGKDRHASTKDIALKNKSVVSGKTLEQLSSDKHAKKWISNKTKKEKKNREPEIRPDKIHELVRHAKKSKMPAAVKPMLCTKIAEAFTDQQWLYELKLDGYRIIAHVRKKKVTLYSRSLLDYTKKYLPVSAALEELEDVILDGEVVVLNGEGKPDFDALQNYSGKDQIAFYVFDVLWFDGYDLTGLPLEKRKELLEYILPNSDVIRFTGHFDDGIALFKQTEEMGLEGIIAKKRDSIYKAGERSKDWLKLPTALHREFVIGGWTESEHNRSFRSLVFGEYQDGRLIYIGHAGGGFKSKEMPEIKKKLIALETKKKPFANEVETDTTVHWVKPQLVAEIRFATWTKYQRIRKPAIFLGFRTDKKAGEVKKEEVVAAEAVRRKETNEEKKRLSAAGNWKDVYSQKITSEDQIEIDGRMVALQNIDRELWKGIPKAKLIAYYNDVSEYILPHLTDRPLSLYLKLRSALQAGIYIKDMEHQQPDWATVFSTKRKHPKPGKRKVIDYLVCNDKATLIYLINLGCIDVNPWTSRTADYLHPDYIVIDLDPSDNDFKKAVEAALAAKEVFSQHKLKAFPKTSGKTGIHLFIPCSGFTFPQCRMIAEFLCEEIHALIPSITTTEVSISKRGNRLYLDPNQNDEADTVAAVYSVRPYKMPTVSTPLQWKEINNRLHPADYTIDTIVKRLEKKGELFADVLSKKVQSANNKQLIKNIV